jgi:hypothetical protein
VGDSDVALVGGVRENLPKRRRFAAIGGIAAVVLSGVTAVAVTAATAPASPPWTAQPPPGGAVLSSGLRVETQSDPGARTAEYTVPISNGSKSEIEILRVGQSGPGLSLQENPAEFPFRLKPGESRQITVSYRVLDCAAVPRDGWPLPVQVRVDDAVGAVWIALPSDGPKDPWQQFLVRPICVPGVSGGS